MKEKEVDGGDLGSDEHLDIWEGEEMLTNGLEKALTATKTISRFNLYLSGLSLFLGSTLFYQAILIQRNIIYLV